MLSTPVYNVIDKFIAGLTFNGKNSKTEKIDKLRHKLKKLIKKLKGVNKLRDSQLKAVCRKIKKMKTQLALFENHVIFGSEVANQMAFADFVTSIQDGNESYLFVKNCASKCPCNKSFTKTYFQDQLGVDGYEYVFIPISAFITQLTNFLIANGVVDPLASVQAAFYLLGYDPSSGKIFPVCYDVLRAFVNRLVKTYAVAGSALTLLNLNVFDTLYALAGTTTSGDPPAPVPDRIVLTNGTTPYYKICDFVDSLANLMASANFCISFQQVTVV